MARRLFSCLAPCCRALTSFEEKEKVVAATNDGMKRFILKRAPEIHSLVDLIYPVYQGEYVFSQEAFDLLDNTHHRTLRFC